jgi:cob(I)alamin adenosyltransferase
MAMKLYTRTGDEGYTVMCALNGKSRRIAKDSPLLAALGDLDELNSCLGLCLAEATRINHINVHDALAGRQNDLFTVGVMLAAMAVESRPTVRLNDQAVFDIERQIDAVCQDLPELKNFILPGGGELACRLHLARTVCRRAERTVLNALSVMTREGLDVAGATWGELAAPAPAEAGIRQFINRLSDLLFALARLANRDAGEPDVIWKA